jgi:hypothetical protein
MAMATALTGLTALAAGATTTAATTTTAAVAVGRMSLTMALTVVRRALRTAGLRTAGLRGATAGAVASAATATTTIAAFGPFAALRGRAGKGRGRCSATLGSGAEETFDPAEKAGGFLRVGAAGSGGRLRGGFRGAGLRLRTTLITGLAGAAVARLRAVATAAIAAAGLTVAATAGVATGGVAAGIGRAFQHGDIAATLRTKHRTLRAQGGLGAGSRGSRSRLGGGGGFGLVREGGRFPALGGTLRLLGRKDVELGLGRGSDGGDDRRDRRDGSGGRSLHGFAGNNRSDLGGSRGHGGRSGGGNVRRSERVGVFCRCGHDLNRGRNIGARGVVAGGGR